MPRVILILKYAHSTKSLKPPNFYSLKKRRNLTTFAGTVQNIFGVHVRPKNKCINLLFSNHKERNYIAHTFFVSI